MTQIGLDLTFNLLATTRNESAVGVLLPALSSPQPAVRRRAVAAIAQRGTLVGGRAILHLWHDLQSDEIAVLQSHPQGMLPAVREALRDLEGPLGATAIEAVRVLGLHELIPPLIEVAESGANVSTRTAALVAVLESANTLGRAARRDTDRPSVRGPIVQRLADAVRRYDSHRCDALIDAFLAVCRWRDRILWTLLEDDPAAGEALARRMRCSGLGGVVELVAGFIRQRRVPSAVDQAMRQRKDASFRDCLLDAVGAEPSEATLRNLRFYKRLPALQITDRLSGDVAPQRHAALLHAVSATDADPLHLAMLVLDILDRGTVAAEPAAAMTLLRSGTPEADALFCAAMQFDPRTPPSWSYADAKGQSAEAVLLGRMLVMIQHPNPAVAAAIKHFLRPLGLSGYLQRFGDLSDAERRRWGRLVATIDAEGIDQLGEELRHSVLQRRLNAAEAAVVLGMVEPALPWLLQMAQSDHQEARMRVATVLGHSTHPEARAMLRRMASGPDGMVRDAASEALQKTAAEKVMAAPAGAAVAPLERAMFGAVEVPSGPSS